GGGNISDCFARDLVLPHEAGHLLGAGHQDGYGVGDSIYSHAIEIKDATGRCLRRTVMATSGDCRNIDRMALFSTPRAILPFGPGDIGDTLHDNVRTLNEQAHKVANYRCYLLGSPPFETSPFSKILPVTEGTSRVPPSDIVNKRLRVQRGVPAV